jgi:Ca2+-binding RTX toxin-like protein
LTSNIVIDESSGTGIDTLDVYEDLTTGPDKNTVTSDLILNTDGSLTFAFYAAGVQTGSFTIKGGIEFIHDYGISSGGNFDTLIKVWTAANGVGTLAANVTNTGGIGSNNADTMTGTVLNDQIWGYGGNDSISGGAGNDKLAGGAEFDRLAQMYSDDSTKDAGGDWGWIERKTLNEDLAKVAFSLKSGQISPVITQANAYYILMVESTKPSVTKPLSQVQDEIVQNLIQKEKIQTQERWLKTLREKAYIKIL